MDSASFSYNSHTGVNKIEEGGYSVAMYRSPNTGDVIIEITAPEGYEDSVTVLLNDEMMERV